MFMVVFNCVGCCIDIWEVVDRVCFLNVCLEGVVCFGVFGLNVCVSSFIGLCLRIVEDLDVWVVF